MGGIIKVVLFWDMMQFWQWAMMDKLGILYICHNREIRYAIRLVYHIMLIIKLQHVYKVQV
jgi:hypothetical protein